MTYRIPVVDLEAALSDSPPAGLLDAVRAAAEQFGVVQVSNHGIEPGLIDEFGRGQAAGRGLPGGIRPTGAGGRMAGEQAIRRPPG
jgi:non-haem dioxygenase in morphine synthesis N-terminal